MKQVNSWVAAAAILLLPLAACDDSDVMGGEDASVSVLVTDAPGDVQAAWVTVSEVRLVAEGGENEETGGSVILLSDGTETFDLLELQNDVEAIVQDADVAAGTYTQLRLVISQGCIEVETETGSEIYASTGFDACGTATGTLKMPSLGQSGLKINLPAGATDFDGEETILLDFDVAESFGHQAGNSGMWVMTPVIRASRFEAAGTVNATLALGTNVQALLDAATLDITDLKLQLDDEAPVALDTSGAVTFEHVPSGSHTLTLVGPGGFTFTTDPVSPYAFSTTAGGTADVTVTLTGLTATG